MPFQPTHVRTVDVHFQHFNHRNGMILNVRQDKFSYINEMMMIIIIIPNDKHSFFRRIKTTWNHFWWGGIARIQSWVSWITGSFCRQSAGEVGPSEGAALGDRGIHVEIKHRFLSAHSLNDLNVCVNKLCILMFKCVFVCRCTCTVFL